MSERINGIAQSMCLEMGKCLLEVVAKGGIR